MRTEDTIESIYSFLNLVHLNAGTVWALTLVFALIFLMALREVLGWYLKTYHIRQEIEKLRSELVQTQNSVQTIRAQLDAVKAGNQELETTVPVAQPKLQLFDTKTAHPSKLNFRTSDFPLS